MGHYDYKTAVLAVTLENDRLFAQLTGQPRFEIFPEGPDKFFWKVTEAHVQFLRDDKGKVAARYDMQNPGNLFVRSGSPPRR